MFALLRSFLSAWFLSNGASSSTRKRHISPSSRYRSDLRMRRLQLGFQLGVTFLEPSVASVPLLLDGSQLDAVTASEEMATVRDSCLAAPDKLDMDREDMNTNYCPAAPLTIVPCLRLLYDLVFSDRGTFGSYCRGWLSASTARHVPGRNRDTFSVATYAVGIGRFLLRF